MFAQILVAMRQERTYCGHNDTVLSSTLFIPSITYLSHKYNVQMVSVKDNIFTGWSGILIVCNIYILYLYLCYLYQTQLENI